MSDKDFSYEWQDKLLGGVLWVKHPAGPRRRIRYFSAVLLALRVARAKRILNRAARSVAHGPRP